MLPVYYQNLQAGLHLIPIVQGLKAPKHRDWNLPGHSIAIRDYWLEEEDPLNGQPVNQISWGVHHVDSRTCALDIDDIEWARFQFWLEGLDLDYYLQRYTGVYSGNPGHAKLMFRLPPGREPIVSKQLYGKRAGEKPFASLNFRCATRAGNTTQDVMPPSLHPGTWECYQWVNDRGLGAASLEYLPPELEAFWMSTLEAAAPVALPAEAEDGEAGPNLLRSALEALDPDCDRTEWITIGMGIHDALGDAGYATFDYWSSRGVKYSGPRDTKAVWQSFHEYPSGITVKSLFALARNAGWQAFMVTPPPSVDVGEAAAEAAFPTQDRPLIPELAAMLGLPEAPAPEPTPEVTPTPANASRPEEVRSRELLVELDALCPITDCNTDQLDAVHKIMAQAYGFENPGFRDPVMERIKEEMHWNTTQMKDHLKYVRKKFKDAMKKLSGELKFPFRNDAGKPTDHSANMRTILNHSGVALRMNRMSHAVEVFHPDSAAWYAEERESIQMAYINDLCVEHGMPYTRSKEHVTTLGTESSYHPFEDYITQTTWDGRDWFQIVANTVKTADRKLWETTFRRWALSVVASVREMTGERPPRGVLVMTGEQLSGKTSWFRYLTPKGMFHSGAHLSPTNKDSVKLATKYAVVEIGELDASIERSNPGRLKAFLSADSDELRLPYAHGESKWKRRTIFCGTVNNPEFLNDQTGNTRYWVNEVIGKIQLDQIEALMKTGGISQFWAQMNQLLMNGETWTLDDKEYAALEANNASHMAFDMVGELLDEMFAWPEEHAMEGYLKPGAYSPVNPMTFTSVAEQLGFEPHRESTNMRRLRDMISRKTGQRRAILHQEFIWESGTLVRRPAQRGRFFHMPFLRSQIDIDAATVKARRPPQRTFKPIR